MADNWPVTARLAAPCQAGSPQSIDDASGRPIAAASRTFHLGCSNSPPYLSGGDKTPRVPRGSQAKQTAGAEVRPREHQTKLLTGYSAHPENAGLA